MTPTSHELLLRMKYSFYGTLIFLLVSNPITYRFTQQLFGHAFATISAGVPTPAGYFLHALLFFALTLAVMMFPKDA